jgi:uroporphyrinogen decarboxylase
MTSRERVMTALDHREPDRVPIDFGGLLASINIYTYDALLRAVGIPAGGDEVVSREWSNVPKPSEELLVKWGVDFRRVWLGGPELFTPTVNEEEKTLKDEWGLTWKRVGKYNEFVNPPLAGASLSELIRFPFPDPTDPGRYRGVREKAEHLFRETECAVVAGHSMFGVFELGCWLCGFDDFLMRLALDRKFVRAFFDRILEVQKEIVGRYLDLVGPFVQIVETADDLGQEYGPLMSPDTYRALIKPYHKAYTGFIKEKAPHAKVFMHTCGSVHDLIPELIDNGVDILNPIQPRARNMEPWRLKRDFGDALCFHGGIDVVAVLPRLPPQGVRETVRDVMSTLGRGGGYILAASHNIQDDTPVQNIAAMYEAGRTFGRYPLPCPPPAQQDAATP